MRRTVTPAAHTTFMQHPRRAGQRAVQRPQKGRAVPWGTGPPFLLWCQFRVLMYAYTFATSASLTCAALNCGMGALRAPAGD